MQSHLNESQASNVVGGFGVTPIDTSLLQLSHLNDLYTSGHMDQLPLFELKSSFNHGHEQDCCTSHQKMITRHAPEQLEGESLYRLWKSEALLGKHGNDRASLDTITYSLSAYDLRDQKSILPNSYSHLVHPRSWLWQATQYEADWVVQLLCHYWGRKAVNTIKESVKRIARKIKAKDATVLLNETTPVEKVVAIATAHKYKSENPYRVSILDVKHTLMRDFCLSEKTAERYIKAARTKDGLEGSPASEIFYYCIKRWNDTNTFRKINAQYTPWMPTVA